MCRSTLYIFTLTLALVPYSCAQQEDIPIRVNPAAVQATSGKLPSSIYLAVFEDEKDCGKTGKDLSAYSIQITGGMTPSSQTSGKCVITANISLDSNTPAGNYSVILLDSGKKVAGHAEFAILDTNAAPIPSGLAPQVDVIWGVLSQSVCKDVFGGRVASYFYCIEVKLGNNTGHPLQLAGIGFKLDTESLPAGLEVGRTLQPNTSYASARAVLLRGSVKDKRNIVYHTVQGAGILMGAFTPYFVRPNAKSHFAIAASIASGAALEAFNIVAPDPVVGHLNNLDDESFRDSQVIPNNTHVRTMVFVEKAALAETLESVFCKLYPSKICAGGNQSAKPAETDTALKAMEQTIKDEDAATINNSRQKNGFLGLKDYFSPFLVKLALGNLVIVGDEIEYLQRVQVQSSAAAVAGVTVSPTKLSFASQPINSPSPAQTVTVTNSGSAAISGIKPEVSGTDKGDFDNSGKPVTTCGDPLAAAASCTISITFKPATGTTGMRAATLNVSFTGMGSPQTVSLEGQAAAATSASTVSLDKTALTFAPQKVNTPSAPQTVTVTNPGSAALDNVSVSVSGSGSSDFTKTDCAKTVAASGGTCAISVTFTPKGTGTSSATLSITYTGAQQPLTVSLNGTGS